MKPSFNLIDEPWIPCLYPDGTQKELSIRDTLFQAEQIKEIHDPNPLITVSLYRFLIALLHRNFGPDNIRKWKDLYKADKFDCKLLGKYFDKWHHRFDLFDEKYPFYQTADLPDKNYHSIAKLYFTADNNATLFDHSTESNAFVISGYAARLLLMFQNFDVGGIKSDGSDKAGVLLGSAVSIIKGDSLYKSLILNMHIYNNNEPFASDNDLPVWESEVICSKKEKTVSGYLEWLTWQSRCIKLKPSIGTDGVIIREAIIMGGHSISKNDNGRNYETMVAYTKNIKAKDNESPWLPIGFRLDRMLWRDSLALFSNVSEESKTSRIIGQVHDLKYENILPEKFFAFNCYGIANKQAKLATLCCENLPLPAELLNNEKYIHRLQRLLGVSEKIASLIREQLKNIIEIFIKEKKDKKKFNEALNRLQEKSNYWNHLEIPFKQIIVNCDTETVTKWGKLIYKCGLDDLTRISEYYSNSNKNNSTIEEIKETYRSQAKQIINEYLTQETEL